MPTTAARGYAVMIDWFDAHGAPVIRYWPTEAEALSDYDAVRASYKPGKATRVHLVALVPVETHDDGISPGASFPAHKIR